MLRHITRDELFSMTTKQRVELFEELLRSTGREGIEQTITSLRESDFYTAPASTKYHNNSLGGLLMHSLLVYAVAVEIYEGIKHVSPMSLDNTKEESLILSALLHDVCKIGVYEKESKWVRDGNGEWVSQEVYVFKDMFPYGHGEKSVLYLTSWGLKMLPSEMLAIRWHMGYWGGLDRTSEMNIRDAINACPLVSIIANADTTSALIIEGLNER